MAKKCNIMTIFKRELKSYFESPVAYVFMVVFLLLSGFMTFSVAQMFERNEASLRMFFTWHPWVYLLLVPAATMGLWAEERRRGTIELLLTMPVTLMQTIIGKFMAAWIFILIGLACTFPVVITVCILGNPDMGAIFSGYLGSALMAGAYVSIGMMTSAMTRNQVIGFVLSLMICLVLILAGWPPITNFFVQWAPGWLVYSVTACSFIPHFESIQRGVIDIQDIVYFLSIIVLMVYTTNLVVDNRKSA